MKSLISERIAYAINLVFVVLAISYSSTRTSNAGDKVTIIYMSWFFLLLYLTGLSIAFYKSNFRLNLVSGFLFKVLSIIPGIYILPAAYFHLTVGSESYSTLNYLFIIGGLFWAISTITNLVIKNSHATKANTNRTN